MRIAMPRTYYAHWGAYSGINQVLKYIDPRTYQIRERLVGDNDDDFPLKDPALRARLRQFVQRRGMEWYKLSDLAAEGWLVGQWATGRADIIHYAEGEHTAQFLPRLAVIPAALRPKIMVTYHQPPSLLETLVDPAVIKYFDHIIVMSPDQATFLARHTDPAKISVVLHGIDTDYFRPADERRPKPTFRCITVGYWQRDYDALEAVARMMAEHEDVAFDIVTSHDTSFSELPNVTIHRKISDAELLQRYQEADLLLLPLHQATANNALLEGLGCGLPIISTALSSVRAYAPGEEALLIERNDPRQIVAGILQLKADPGLRERMAQASRRRALELDWRAVAPRYERLYDQLYHRNARVVEGATRVS